MIAIDCIVTFSNINNSVDAQARYCSANFHSISEVGGIDRSEKLQWASVNAHAKYLFAQSWSL